MTGLFRRKPVQESLPPCADRHNCAELNRVHHEVRNAMIGIQHERKEMLRAANLASRGVIQAYEHIGIHLARMERALRSDPGPTPEDAI
jgi:hypothetical protein